MAGVPSRLGEVGAGLSSRFGEVGVGVSVPTAIGLQRSESASASASPVGLQRSESASASLVGLQRSESASASASPVGLQRSESASASASPVGLQRSESASASLVGSQRSELGSASSADVVAWRGRAGREVIVDVGPSLPYFFDCNSGRVARYGTRREAALSILLYISVNQRVHEAPGSRGSVTSRFKYQSSTSSLNYLTLLITE